MSELPATEVAIIGGGFSGIAAARRIKEAGRKAVVLEARDRVGGRNWDPQFPDGRVVRLGSIFISKHQTRMWSLGEEFGLTAYIPKRDGDILFDTGDGFIRVPGEPEPDPEFTKVIKKLDDMAATVPVDAPWTAKNAEQWDRQTLGTWLQTNVDAELIEAMTPTIMAFMSMPEDLSLLHALFYARANGGFSSLFAFSGEDAHDTHMFAEGANRITEGIHKELGDRVRLNSPVDAIHQSDGGVHIEGKGFSLSAQRVIVALPPTLCGSLRYDPPLPATRTLLTQRSHMSGRDITFTLMYKRPFWRNSGLSGDAQSPGLFVSDSTPPHGRWAVLEGYLWDRGPGKKIVAMSPRDRQDHIIHSLEAAFGEEHARQFISYHEHDWAADDLSRGCVAVFGPAAWTYYGSALREPIGRIHWAGTETSTEFPGQMEGAVRAGERAADEVLRLLS